MRYYNRSITRIKYFSEQLKKHVVELVLKEKEIVVGFDDNNKSVFD